jgi:hypothetical protein
MTFLKNIFINIFRRDPIRRLGRWTIEYDMKMYKNIDLSNNDHSFIR